MTTKQSMFTNDEESEDIIIFRYKPREDTQEGTISFKQRLRKWFGVILMFALGAASFMPNTLHIPAGFRPWVFVTFILWLFAFCEGLFNA